METDGALIGATEAAECLGISRPTLTRWVQSGRVAPHTKLPRKNGALVFKREAIEALAAERAR